jgi:hypothetical protein
MGVSAEGGDCSSIVRGMHRLEDVMAIRTGRKAYAKRRRRDGYGVTGHEPGPVCLPMRVPKEKGSDGCRTRRLLSRTSKSGDDSTETDKRSRSEAKEKLRRKEIDGATG